jgi:hypothetical protein
MEGLHGPEFLAPSDLFQVELPAVRLFLPTGLSYSGKDSGALNDWTRFTWLVSRYSSRQMTFEHDVLNAFRDIMLSFQRVRPSAHNVCGLPLFAQNSNTVVQSLEQLVFTALSWCARVYIGVTAPRRRYAFPSWTWTGWQCVVDSIAVHRQVESCTSILRDMQL